MDSQYAIYKHISCWKSTIPIDNKFHEHLLHINKKTRMFRYSNPTCVITTLYIVLEAIKEIYPIHKLAHI